MLLVVCQLSRDGIGNEANNRSFTRTIILNQLMKSLLGYSSTTYENTIV